MFDGKNREVVVSDEGARRGGGVRKEKQSE